MPPSIEAVKNRLRHSFLGKGGIHAIGLSRAQQAIRVYLNPKSGADQTEILEQLRKSAAPFRIIVVEEESPRINPPADAP